MDYIAQQKIHDYAGQNGIKYVQQKMNGFYLEVYKALEFGIACFYKERKENVWPKLMKIPHIEKSLNSLPTDTIVIGELHCPGIPATSVVTMVNEADKRLQFSPFAMPLFGEIDGNTLSLEDADHQLKKYGLFMPDFYHTYNIEPDVNSLLQKAIELGIEGWVLKRSHLEGWFKLKPQKTVDAFVHSFTLSDSITFFNKLKAFQVAVYDNDNPVIIASVSSGLDHQFKKSCKPEDWVGKVMEVKYQDVASKGKLQFPRFVRWREECEKKAKQCTIDQLGGC